MEKDEVLRKMTHAKEKLTKEYQDFVKFNQHLRSAIAHTQDSNDKLYNSLKQRCESYQELQNRCREVEINIEEKVKQIYSLDQTQNQIIVAPNELFPLIMSTKNDYRNFTLQYFVGIGEYASIDQLKAREAEFLEEKEKLQARFNKSKKRIELEYEDKFQSIEDKVSTILDLKDKIWHLKRVPQPEEAKVDPETFLDALDMHVESSDSIPDLSSALSDEIIDVETDPYQEDAIYSDNSTQTNNNILTREAAATYGQEIHTAIVQQNLEEVEKLEKELTELNKIIKHNKHEYRSKIKEIKSNIKLEPVQELFSEEPFIIHYADAEVEPITTFNMDELQEKVNTGYQRTSEMLKKNQERLSHESIFEQRVLESKLLEMSNNRKDADLKSLLKRLRIQNPIEYSQVIGHPSRYKLDPSMEKKKNQYGAKLQNIDKKIIKIKEETVNLGNAIKEAKGQLALLEQEKKTVPNPRNELASICETITSSQEDMHYDMRNLAFTRIEMECLENERLELGQKISRAALKKLAAENQEYADKLKRMKLRFNFIRPTAKRRTVVVTSEAEIQELVQLNSQHEESIQNIEEKIENLLEVISNKLAVMRKKNIRIPPRPNVSLD